LQKAVEGRGEKMKRRQVGIKFEGHWEKAKKGGFQRDKTQEEEAGLIIV